MDPTDGALLTAWQDGDKQAGRVLFQRYYEPVARFFRNKMTGDIADLIQETFTRIVEGHGNLRDSARFRSYAFSIAYRVFHDHLRSKYRHGSDLDLEQRSVADLAPGPSSVLARSREERLLLEALRHIPISYQVLLELRYWEELKTIEIAEILDIAHGTVRSRLHHAHQLLEQAMTRLAESPEQLHSTLEKLSDWANACRERVRRQIQAPEASPAPEAGRG
jgi:RNA polymerase sigma-70 factor (ECF subfamily)